jgi:16S rRNA pseudouridine516 synthase
MSASVSGTIVIIMDRLDKYLTQATDYTRSQAKKIISQNRVKVDGCIINQAKFKLNINNLVEFDGKALSIESPRYILLHKPAGYICSTQDEVYPSALNLVAKPTFNKLHFAGRLDVDTTGLVLISDDGQWTHKVTSPKKQCRKIYRVTTARVVDINQIEQLERGVELNGEENKTLASKVELVNSTQILLTIFEGRYHQVKRMLAAVGNHVESLHREQVGDLTLAELKEGEWRALTKDEIELF